MMLTKDEILALASSLGANLVGVARARSLPEYLKQVEERLRETGATAEDYMLPEEPHPFFEGLADPFRTLATARSTIVLGVYAYDQDGDYSATAEKKQGKTARTYAYYPVIREIAEEVCRHIQAAGHTALHGQQVPLKYVARKMGLGAYGHNGLLLTKKFGSYVALRCIITDAELEPDAFSPPQTPCDTCGKCLKACPTGALYAPYKVDPERCVNPLTRKETDIPPELRKGMGNWVCGCDVCQEVCPMNRALEPRIPDERARFDPDHHASHKHLGGLARTPDLMRLTKQTDDRVMRRNALIALGNIASE